MSNNFPHFKHNCADCLFVGHDDVLGDCYVCGGSAGAPGGSLMLRTGEAEHDFSSQPVKILRERMRCRPRMTCPLTMALQKWRDEIRTAVRYASWRINVGWTPRGAGRISRDEALARWPRLCAHLICVSLGYAMPTTAGNIVADYFNGQPNWCEWIDACYARNPAPPIKEAFVGRRRHKGYMAEYGRAKQLVTRELSTPGSTSGMLASWF